MIYIRMNYFAFSAFPPYFKPQIIVPVVKFQIKVTEWSRILSFKTKRIYSVQNHSNFPPFFRTKRIVYTDMKSQRMAILQEESIYDKISISINEVFNS